MKKIFIINYKPRENSYREPFINAYIDEAKKSGNEVRYINLNDINIEYFKFDGDTPDFGLNDELKQAQDNMVWADQIVFSYPIWWFAMPAKYKSFIERVFQEGIVVNMGKMGPEPLMKNKTAVIMQSYDMPYFAMKYIYGDAPMQFLKVVLSKWCGIKIEKRFDLDMISSMTEAKKLKYINRLKKFASKIK